ncbi:hypothetical protein Bca4012_065949 [Brassica carinata]
MNSRQVLRIIHGTWNLNQNGEWSSERKPNDIGFPALVRSLENFESLEQIVRSLYNLRITTPTTMTYRLPEWMLVPDGNRTPPTTILRTPDVDVMMAVRVLFAELTLCVTLGPEDVARFQFMCRTNFNIGAFSYVFGKGNGDLSFEAFLGETVVASQSLLEQYFNDQEMLVIHRVHLEMEKAKLNLENQKTMEVFHDKQIILIDDDSHSEVDLAEPHGSQQVSVPIFGNNMF